MQARAIKTRDKILTTAIELFAARGFHGTKIDAIAAAAKVNKQRIYAYFGNKSQLFEQSLVTLFSEVNRFEEATLKLDEQELSGLSEMLLRKYMDLHDRYPNFLRLLAWANLESTVPVEHLLDIKNNSFARLRNYFKQACEAGFIARKISFETWIFNIMAAAWFYHSNRQTLQHTLSEKMFTAAGREAYILETARQFSEGNLT